jgi:hypothetical protein
MPASYEVDELEGNAFVPLTGEAQGESAEQEMPADDRAGAGQVFVSHASAEVVQEADPLFSIRPAMAAEHANLAAEEITTIFGREPATLALHSLLGSPQPRQAALAALLGRAGRRIVQVDGRDVAVPVYLRLLSRLCAEAAEHNEQEIATEAQSNLEATTTFEQEQATSNCPGPVNRIISGWGQYADEVNKLPAAERVKIDELADLIVTSFARQGCVPFRQVTIVGHADRDWHGPKYEMDVSFKRANAVAAALTAAVRALWVARGLGPPPQGGVEWTTRGKGAKQMIAPPYRPANRRVEIALIAAGQPIQPPPAPDSFEERIHRFLELLKTRRVDPDPTGKRTERARCILGKMPNALDVFVDGTASNQQIGTHFVGENLCSWQGNYDPPPLPQADLLKFLGSVSAILKGPGFAPSVSDDQILKGLSQLIFMINEGIVRVERYITLNSSDFGYTGDRTRGTRLSSIFADHLDDPNSIYSCYKDFHGGE